MRRIAPQAQPQRGGGIPHPRPGMEDSHTSPYPNRRLWVIFPDLRCHTQVVRERSAKPLFPGSNPGGTSNLKHTMHAPSNRPRLVSRASRAAGLGLLLLVSGCDWRTPAERRETPGVLDLSDYAEGLDDWRCRQDDIGRLPALRLEPAPAGSLLVVESRGGLASRWRRKVRWDAESHRVLTWTWSLGGRVDSLSFTRKAAPAAAMAVDVTLASAFGFHKTVRYVWSARADRGAVWSHRDNWHPKVRVLRDSRDSVGALVSENVDVWKDFEQLWGFTPRHQALAIVVSVLDPVPGKRLVGRFGPIFAHPQETP